MSNLLFYAQFKSSSTKLGVDVTATVNIWRIARADGTKTAVISAGATTYVGDGIRQYLLSDADLDTYDYVGSMTTADTTVADRQPACLWTRWDEANTARITALGTALGLVKTVTDKFLFDASNFVKSAAQSLVGFVTNAGTGANAVTITVTDGTDPLQNAAVRLSEGANSFTATTDADGVATFSLDNATYTLAITKAGYSFTPTTLVVDGAESVEVEMTLIAAPAPTSPSMSALYLDVIDDGAAKDGVEVRATLQGDRPIAVDGDYEGEVMTKKVSGHGATAGRVTFDTYPGLDYRITSTKLGLDKTVTAPAVGTSADVYDLDAVA